MSAAPFNDAQVRHIVATLRHIDDLLAHAMCSDTGPGSSAQARHAIPPETDAALSGMQKELHSALEFWAPAESSVPVELRWALLTALRLAQISLVELDGMHIGHYGRVDPKGLGQLDETRARLEAGLEKVRATLERTRPAPRP